MGKTLDISNIRNEVPDIWRSVLERNLKVKRNDSEITHAESKSFAEKQILEDYTKMPRAPNQGARGCFTMNFILLFPPPQKRISKWIVKS